MPAFPLHILPYAGVAAGLLVMLSLMARRIPFVGLTLRLASWTVIALLVVTVARQRSLFDPHFAKLIRVLNLDRDEQRTTGKELRVPMASDGHFWVRARVNGVERRMLVDSGATITALSVETAEAAGLRPEKSPFPVILKTANGSVAAATSNVSTLRIGNIVARHLPVVVSSSFGDTEVIGMNFLSKLKSWRVEGDILILVPHHSQAPADPVNKSDRG